MKKPLKSLETLKALDAKNETLNIKEIPRCKHELKLISATEVLCSKCGAGWQGHNVHELLG